MKKRFIFTKTLPHPGFTLAEVLITLGIIGVVAAMTLPALISEQQKKQFLNQAKVIYNILNNALEASKPEYGTDVNNWEVLNEGTNLARSMYFSEKYLIPHLKVTEYCKDKTTSRVCSHKVSAAGGNAAGDFTNFSPSTDVGTTFALSNSAIISVQSGRLGEVNNRVRIGYDVNGLQKPNLIGKDVFFIELGGGVYSSGNKNKNIFLPYMYDSSQPCDFYKTSSSLGGFQHRCLPQEDRSSCLAYIVCRGWDIPDDYPW